MTPREKTVGRAIVKALQKSQPTDMDALSTSLNIDQREYRLLAIKPRAVMVLTALMGDNL